MNRHYALAVRSLMCFLCSYSQYKKGGPDCADDFEEYDWHDELVRMWPHDLLQPLNVLKQLTRGAYDEEEKTRRDAADKLRREEQYVKRVARLLGAADNSAVYKWLSAHSAEIMVTYEHINCEDEPGGKRISVKVRVGPFGWDYEDHELGFIWGECHAPLRPDDLNDDIQFDCSDSHFNRWTGFLEKTMFTVADIRDKCKESKTFGESNSFDFTLVKDITDDQQLVWRQLIHDFDNMDVDFYKCKESHKSSDKWKVTDEMWKKWEEAQLPLAYAVAIRLLVSMLFSESEILDAVASEKQKKRRNEKETELCDMKVDLWPHKLLDGLQ